jgi:enoyl-CoA hydratase/carnithine racemase
VTGEPLVLREATSWGVRLTLNRPDKLNALTDRMLDELLDAFDAADADDAVRAVVVTGAGKAFCAGADLSGGGFHESPAAGQEVPRDRGGVITLRIFESLKPVIGAINGAAVGVGASMTLAMDVRLASTFGRLGFVYVRRGIVPEGASSWFLPRLVGMGTAMEWVLSGRMVAPDEARRAGLVRSVHTPSALLPAAHAIAREMADHAAPVSAALTRRLLWRMAGEPHPMNAHRYDSRAIAARRGSADAREGVAAFMEKRPPEFPDRVSDGLPDVFADFAEPPFS